MATLANLVVKLVADIAEFEKNFEKAHSKAADFERNMKKIGDGLTNTGKTMTVGMTLPIVGGMALAVDAASDMNETLSKSQVVFGDMAGEVQAFAATAPEALGMTSEQALAASSTYGNLFTAMKIGPEASAEMSTGLVQLAADLASFNNMDPTEVLQKLQSGLVGETEPLKSLGVNLNQAAIESKAMEMGLATSTKELTPAMKAQASYALIMEQTGTAQGDFARTADGLANTQRTLKGQMGNLAATMGTYLLPFVLQLVDKISKLVGWFTALSPETQKTILVILGIVAGIGPVLLIVGQLITAIGTISTVFTAVSGVIGPIMAAISGPVLLVIGAIIGIIALLYLAWTNNWGGIREKFAAVWDWLSGVFQDVKTWLETNIPIALEKLKNFWDNVLLPALNRAWAFIEDNILPIFQLVIDIVTRLGEIALTALAGFWENVLLPALEKARAFFQDKIIPIFEKVREFIEEKLGPAVVWLKEKVFEPLGAALEGGVKRGLAWVKDNLEKLKGFLDKFKLPDWLTPGSPTPFELGLIGIAEAMQQLNKVELPEFKANLKLEPVGVAAMAGWSRPAPTMGGERGGAVVNQYINDPLSAERAARRTVELLNRR